MVETMRPRLTDAAFKTKIENLQRTMRQLFVRGSLVVVGVLALHGPLRSSMPHPTRDSFDLVVALLLLLAWFAIGNGVYIWWRLRRRGL